MYRYYIGVIAYVDDNNISSVWKSQALFDDIDEYNRQNGNVISLFAVGTKVTNEEADNLVNKLYSIIEIVDIGLVSSGKYSFNLSPDKVFDLLNIIDDAGVYFCRNIPIDKIKESLNEGKNNDN